MTSGAPGAPKDRRATACRVTGRAEGSPTPPRRSRASRTSPCAAESYGRSRRPPRAGSRSRPAAARPPLWRRGTPRSRPGALRDPETAARPPGPLTTSQAHRPPRCGGHGRQRCARASERSGASVPSQPAHAERKSRAKGSVTSRFRPPRIGSRRRWSPRRPPRSARRSPWRPPPCTPSRPRPRQSSASSPPQPADSSKLAKGPFPCRARRSASPGGQRTHLYARGAAAPEEKGGALLALASPYTMHKVAG